MQQSKGPLTAKQRRAIAILLAAPTISAAASTLGVGEQTLYTWLTEPAFADAYRRARRELVAQAISKLQSATSAAVSTLIDAMTHPPPDGAVRVTAARAILELALQGVELEDVETRLRALEGTEAHTNSQALSTKDKAQ